MKNKSKIELTIGKKVKGLTASNIYFEGEIIKVLQNTVILKKGVQTEVVRKENILPIE